VTYDGGPAGLLSHPDSFDGLGQRAYLVSLMRIELDASRLMPRARRLTLVT
jgi:hypothetical protein